MQNKAVKKTLHRRCVIKISQYLLKKNFVSLFRLNSTMQSSIYSVVYFIPCIEDTLFCTL